MTIEEIGLEDKVQEILADQLGINPEKVIPEASLINDLAADSMDIAELEMAFEEEFGLDLDIDVEEVKTVADLNAYIKKMKEQTA